MQLTFQSRRNSHFIGGVGWDAELLANTILSARESEASRTRRRQLAPFPHGPRTAIVDTP